MLWRCFTWNLSTKLCGRFRCMKFQLRADQLASKQAWSSSEAVATILYNCAVDRQENRALSLRKRVWTLNTVLSAAGVTSRVAGEVSSAVFFVGTVHADAVIYHNAAFGWFSVIFDTLYLSNATLNVALGWAISTAVSIPAGHFFLL